MAYNRRKRKVKKNIPEAQAHIQCTYNNTVVSISDNNGNVISWASAGTIGYKGSKKVDETVTGQGSTEVVSKKDDIKNALKSTKYSQDKAGVIANINKQIELLKGLQKGQKYKSHVAFELWM